MDNAILELKALADKLQHELERQQAVIECTNLMGRYAFWHSVNMHEEKKVLFANEHPDYRAEIFESYVGPDGFDLYVKGHSYMGEDFNKGTIRMHALTTPVIEVAEDGQSARGVWICPGYETGKSPKFEGATEADDYNFDCKWAWNKYGIDFINTEAGWRILHLHVYGLFMTDYYTSWADSDKKHPGGGGPPKFSDEEVARMLETMTPYERHNFELMKKYSPNAPATCPTWHYARDRAPENLPAPPERYKTFSDIKETY